MIIKRIWGAFFAAVMLCMGILVRADEINEISVPMLAYHDFSEKASHDFVVSSDVFESHISAISEAGYTAISFRELIDFVNGDGVMPNKPILIVADDGYSGVLDIASPIARKYGMKLSCAVIGSLADASAGHFSLNCDIPDNVEIVSHTYAMHDRTGFDGLVAQSCASEDYRRLLLSDRLAFGEWSVIFPMINEVMVYPHGSYNSDTERLLSEMGCSVSVTCDYGTNIVCRGKPETLRKMRRITVWGQTTDEELMCALRRFG